MYILDNLSTITQEGCMETRQMIPFFLSIFSNLFAIIISEFENAQNSFSCGPAVGPFWSVKYLNVRPKVTDSDSSSHFTKSRHPEVTNDLHYVLYSSQSQISIFFRVQLMNYTFHSQDQKFLTHCSFSDSYHQQHQVRKNGNRK